MGRIVGAIPIPYPNPRRDAALREGERLVLLAGVFVIVGGIGTLSAIGYAVWCAVAFVAAQW